MVAPEEMADESRNNSVEEQHPTPRRWGGMLGLSTLAVVLIFASVIAIQLMGIIYALIFPPDAPLPDDAVEMSHENRSYGSDRYLYGTNVDGCALVAFYEADGAQCRVAPGVCGPNGFEISSPGQQNVATCSGEVEFSIFALRWRANIASGYSVEPFTRFNLEQDVLWFGTGPDVEDTE